MRPGDGWALWSCVGGAGVVFPAVWARAGKVDKAKAPMAAAAVRFLKIFITSSRGAFVALCADARPRKPARRLVVPPTRRAALGFAKTVNPHRAGAPFTLLFDGIV